MIDPTKLAAFYEKVRRVADPTLLLAWGELYAHQALDHQFLEAAE